MLEGNQDTSDWCLNGSGVSSCAPPRPQNPTGLDTEIASFINGPKAPGLVLLEHELNADTVGAFLRAYPKWISAGWKLDNIPNLWNVPWYQNAQDNKAQPSQLTVGSGNISFISVSNSAAPASTVSLATTASAVTTTRMATGTIATQQPTIGTKATLAQHGSSTSLPPQPYQTGHKNSAAFSAPQFRFLVGLFATAAGSFLFA